MLKVFRGSPIQCSRLGCWIVRAFTTNYGKDNLFHFGTLPAFVQVGMGLHLAALAALAGDAQLATRLRHRAADEAAEGREQEARRARIQNGCLAAQCRFILADTSRNRLQLSEALAVLLEELRPPQNTQGGCHWGAQARG